MYCGPQERTDRASTTFFAAKPSLFTTLTSTLSTLRIGTPAVEEKRPTFAFLRRIRDHRKFGLSALSDSSEGGRYSGYTAVLTNASDSVVALVSEWADQLLEGTHGNDADVEKRLEGMVEEVAWAMSFDGVGG